MISDHPVKRFVIWYIIVFVIGLFPTMFIYFWTKKSWLETELKGIINYYGNHNLTGLDENNSKIISLSGKHIENYRYKR